MFPALLNKTLGVAIAVIFLCLALSDKPIKMSWKSNPAEPVPEPYDLIIRAFYAFFAFKILWALGK